MAIMNKCEHDKYHGLCRICFPLYTHPVKQLSDEEINKIYLEKYDGHMGFLSPDEVRDFARAIIKEITE